MEGFELCLNGHVTNLGEAHKYIYIGMLQGILWLERESRRDNEDI